MRLLKPIIPALFGLLASVASAQIPAPQINLSGNIGCQGFPCFNVGTLKFTSDANRSMTAQESSAQSPSLMVVTSTVSLTTTRNLIAPAGRFSFTIENVTTGGQSIQIIGPSGTGVTIPNGQAVSVGNDGSNYVQVGSGGSVGVAPALSVYSNPTNSSATPAFTNYPIVVGIEGHSVSSIVNFSAVNTTAATSSVNASSAGYNWTGNYWTGAVSSPDEWSSLSALGTGSNPSSILTFAHSAGSSGFVGVSVPNLIDAALTPGTTPVCPNGAHGELTVSGCVSGGFTNPMTTLGDSIYGGASGVATRLPGNTAATDEVYVSHGTGSAAQIPALTNAPAISAANMTGFPTNLSAYVQTNGVANQVLNIPNISLGSGGGSFTIQANSGSASNTLVTSVNDPYTTQIAGTSSSGGDISTENILTGNGNTTEYSEHWNNLHVDYPGTYAGNYWTVSHVTYDNYLCAQRGICQDKSAYMYKPSVGDGTLGYEYGTFYGGMNFFNDEGVYGSGMQVHQMGWQNAAITAGAGVGSSSITTGAITCNADGGSGCSFRPYNVTEVFPDGAWMFDKTQGGSTASLASIATTNGVLTATFSGTSFTPSTAWGTEASCSTSTPQHNQVYFSTTCTVTLSTGGTPSPGYFVSGQNMFIVGPYTEQVAVTAVGAASGATQTVTFSSKNDWNVNSPTFFMQGGSHLGDVIVSSSAWPIAWPIAGSFSATQLVFGNCVNGSCTGSVSGNLPSINTATFYPAAEIIGTGGVTSKANLATNTVNWTVGDQVVAAPTNSYQVNGIALFMSKGTPNSGGQASYGIRLIDEGPAPLQGLYNGTNQGTSPEEFLHGKGPLSYIFNLESRPYASSTSNLGALFQVGFASVGSASQSYYLWQDSGGGDIKITPGSPATVQVDANFSVTGTATFGTQSLTGTSTYQSGSLANFASGSGLTVASGGTFTLASGSVNNINSDLVIGSAAKLSGNGTNGVPLYGNGGAFSSIEYTNSGNTISGSAFESSTVARIEGYVGYPNATYSNALIAGYTVMVAQNDSFGIRLCSFVGSGICGLTFAIGSNNAVFGGTATTPQVIVSGSAPTMVAGAAAGTSPSCTTITGANMAGVITCTTGTATTTTGTLATITFNGTLGTAPQGCSLQSRNAATALILADEFTTAPSTTSWTIEVAGVALSTSTAYSWSYSCI